MAQREGLNPARESALAPQRRAARVRAARLSEARQQAEEGACESAADVIQRARARAARAHLYRHALNGAAGAAYDLLYDADVTGSRPVFHTAPRYSQVSSAF